MLKPNDIVLLGPPGSGKGTLAKQLVERNNFFVLGAGDLLRDEVASGSNRGKEIKALIDQGKFAPEDMTCAIMWDAIQAHMDQNPGSHFVFDGFPRSSYQAAELEKMRPRYRSIHDPESFHLIVLNLLCGKHEILDRLVGRQSCPACKTPYHVRRMPPKVEGRCDHDGVELVARADDNEEGIAQRLELYHENNDKLLNFYKYIDTVDRLSIVANGTPEETYQRVANVLGLEPPTGSG